MEKWDIPEGILSKEPQLGTGVFIAPGAQVMGNVVLGDNVSIWYNSVLRGDINGIYIGARSNIQDCSVLHVENDRACHVGQDVTVGHRAILHGCTIEDRVLIGMGAIILNGAKVGAGSVIAAGAVVKENEIIPPLSLVVGVPGKIVRTLPETTLDIHKEWAAKYIAVKNAHQSKLGYV